MTTPPRSRIDARHASCIHTNGPRRLTRKFLSHCSRVASTTNPKWTLAPALLTRMSTAPNRSTVASMQARASSGSPALAANAATSSPGSPLTTSSSASCLRDENITDAPARAYAVAIAQPMPRDAPVTSATLPRRSIAGAPSESATVSADGTRGVWRSLGRSALRRSGYRAACTAARAPAPGCASCRATARSPSPSPGSRPAAWRR